VRANVDFALLVVTPLYQNQPFSVVISGILLHCIYIRDASKQKKAIGLIGDNLLTEVKIQLHAYLLLKEQLVYLPKCLHEMMLVFVGFDEPGNGNQEVNCNPLYPGSLEIHCRSQSVYTE
jgi:hypothetical protein